MSEVGVIGAGYVGLATAACLAHVGHRVTCVDRDAGRVADLRGGGMPFYEPGLGELVDRGTRAGRLSFAGSGEIRRLAWDADVVFIAVGTPQGEDGAADLSGVAAVAREIGRGLAGGGRKKPLVVVNKSTVPAGSGDQVSALIRDGAGGRGADFGVVSNPEFLREGSAVHDSLFPDRIVVGADSGWAPEVLRNFYRPIIEQSFSTALDPRPRVTVPFVVTDLASAEMIKYAANAFLATKISFINEISDLCELTGADVGSVATGIGLDERIGPRFLEAGIGWGGSCFPKDVAALRASAGGRATRLLDATVAVNTGRREKVVSMLEADLGGLKDRRVALLGLSFKQNTDDLRNAPGLEIAGTIAARGAATVGYDPVAGKAAAGRMPALEVVFDPYEALDGAHAAVVATAWESIRGLDLRRAASLMAQPRLLVDGRNLFDPAGAREAGLLYRGFGRG